jgi:MFS family permease
MKKTMKIDEQLPRAVYLSVTAFFFTSLASSVLMPFLPLYLCNIRHIPLQTAGLAFLVMGLGQLIISPIAGKLNDHFSPKTILFCSPAIRALFLLLLAWSVYAEQSFSTILVLLFFASAAGRSTGISIDSYLARSIPQHQLNRAHSRLTVAMNIGWIIGPIGGAYMSRTPFSLIFILTAFCCLISATIILFFCPKPQQAPAVSMSKQYSWYNTFKLIFKNRTYLCFLIGVFLVIGSYYQFFSNFSIYATNSLNISKNMLGTLYLINAALIVTLQLPTDKVCKTFTMKNKVILGIIFFTIGATCFAFAQNLWQLIIAIIFFTFGEILTIPVLRAMVPRFATKENTGSYIGVYGLFYSLGASLGPYLGSQLYGSSLDWKAGVLWGTVAVTLMFGLIIFSFMPNKFETAE